ncbi:MAG: rhodanese [Legionellales bacterium RIFCSPHIGHO2_12_FULL_42_9]|nr:MAG: rhodanese [Legionellales bacterium RIFCSPHIGHO2_12_FULL_42_9]
MKSVDAKTAKEWFDNKEAIIVDVREPEEYGASHIAGATLVPLGQLKKDKLPNFKNKKLIIHCQLGKRGGMACEKLLTADPTLEVYNLEGGIIAWQKAGLKVEASETFTLPLDQQIQVIVGSGVVLGVIIGFLFHPIFFLVSACFGAGLLYSGITGNCELANLIKKMPWNKE